jgi:hypothetical protein
MEGSERRRQGIMQTINEALPSRFPRREPIKADLPHQVFDETKGKTIA